MGAALLRGSSARSFDFVSWRRPRRISCDGEQRSSVPSPSHPYPWKVWRARGCRGIVPNVWCFQQIPSARTLNRSAQQFRTNFSGCLWKIAGSGRCSRWKCRWVLGHSACWNSLESMEYNITLIISIRFGDSTVTVSRPEKCYTNSKVRALSWIVELFRKRN